jgi:hypothetical protein
MLRMPSSTIINVLYQTYIKGAIVYDLKSFIVIIGYYFIFNIKLLTMAC